jgi:nickel-dependent lactate racemase
MEKTTDYDEFMEAALRDEFFIIDQWQVQKYAKVVKKARVVTVSDGLSSKQKDAMHLDWSPNVEEALQQAFERHGKDAKVAVMPKGPYILSRIQT